MTNPFAPPRDASTSSGRSVLDTLFPVVLAVVLAPHVLLNATLWLEHLQGIGLYDPQVGGDPAWRGRSLIGPLFVAVFAAVRLFVARGRLPLGRGSKRAYVALAAAAVLTALVALIPEPSFSWGPAG